MGSSTTIRLVFGVLTFTIIARFLGPAAFGVFMVWLSIATLSGLLANFGFTLYLLREIGIRPDTAHTVMSEVLSAKILISLTLLVISLIALPFISEEHRWIFLILMMAMLADSGIEFLNVGYRATNRFAAETRIATIASTLQFLVITGSIWYSANVLSVALGLLVSRILILTLTWHNQGQYFANLRPAHFSRALFRIRNAISYAFDFFLQSLFGQIDSLVLHYYLGPLAVGIHQAGMRLVVGGGQASNVLGNVYIPRISAVMGNSTQLQREGERLQTAFIITGAAFGLFLAVASEQIVNILFGHQFILLINLLPWFGFLFFVRFLASACGIMLTSAGKQNLRAKANLGHWVIILLVSALLVPNYGNMGWILSLTIGNLFLATIYFISSVRLVRPTITNTLITVAGAGAFLPFLPSAH